MGRKNTIKRIQKNSKKLQEYDIDLCWWDKFKFEDLTLVNEEGMKLKGHFLDREKEKTVLLIHGYGADYREMENYANMFYHFGFNILVVENRGHGQSEGNYIGMGWLDRKDVVEWINFIVKRRQKDKVVLFGLSMGASAVCMTLGEKLPSNVVCAIEDCGFDNIYKQFEYVYHRAVKLPTKWVLNLFNRYMMRAYNFNLKEGDASQSLKQSKLPIMFIHGSKDTFVPTEMVYRLAENVPESRKEILIVEGAGHAMSYPTDPLLYEYRVKKFLRKYNI